jgi:hypothetical protein
MTNNRPQELNLRWSKEPPSPKEIIVKGHPVGYPVCGNSLDVSYLLDTNGELWSLGQSINAWMKPINMSVSARSFPCEIFGTTQKISCRIASGTCDYYRLNVVCYAVVERHKSKTYSSFLNTEHEYNSKGVVKSIALIIDQDELKHRWVNSSDQWNLDNTTHPSLPILEIPPPVSEARKAWLQSLSEGSLIRIVSPYHFRLSKSHAALGEELFLYPQKANVEQLGKKTLYVSYDREWFAYYRRMFKNGEKAAQIKVPILSGIKSEGNKALFWIEPR